MMLGPPVLAYAVAATPSSSFYEARFEGRTSVQSPNGNYVQMDRSVWTSNASMPASLSAVNANEVFPRGIAMTTDM